MNIVVCRKYRRPTYTIGVLSVDGEPFCDTLEDPVRPRGVKIAGQTAVPAGAYEVVLTYSPRFKRVLPLLLDVPAYEGVRIHAGNTAADTAGCILVGFNRQRGKVLDSRATEAALVQKMQLRAAAGEKIYIEIKER